MSLPAAIDAGALAAFFQVILIDVALAGDNAVAVGLVAASLPPAQRRRAIMLGLTGAVVMLIGLALIATQLLKVVGLSLAGGFLLLWVCWKMWRQLRAEGRKGEEEGQAVLEGHDPHAVHHGGKPKTMRQALLQILAADLAMSLDNVLAVAGAARDHPMVLVVGLLLSITLMGLAASWIAKLLHRFQWIGYLGLVIVLYVAGHMIWDGSRSVAVQTGQTGVYNNVMPNNFDITPGEAAKRKSH